jgi:hypothetical protein
MKKRSSKSKPICTACYDTWYKWYRDKHPEKVVELHKYKCDFCKDGIILSYSSRNCVRRCNTCKKKQYQDCHKNKREHYKLISDIWRKNNSDKVRQAEKRFRDKLSAELRNPYLRHLLKKRGVPKDSINQSILELYKELLTAKRIIKKGVSYERPNYVNA